MSRERNGLRIPPQNADSEKALLGSILLKYEVLYDLLDFIKRSAFYSERHRLIFDAMHELFVARTPIDVLSLSARLLEKGQLDSVGGKGYLAELVNSVPSAANAIHYAEIVYKKHMMRELIRAADSISELGYDEAEELDSLLDRAEKTLYDVTDVSGVHKFISLSETLGDSMERLDKLHKNKNAVRGVSTGFNSLDGKLSGLQNSDLIILAARPSMGKTALALDIARQAAGKNNVPVGVFSLEMSAQQLADRMLSAESRVDSWRLRTGKISTDEEWNALQESLGRLSKYPIFIDDQPANTILKMRSVARRLKREKGLGLIVVDYLQLMQPTSTRAADSMVQQVTELSRSLKQLARELDVPVLALSQLSRAVESRGGRPRLSDLRDSGSIEQDADVVMFIHREDKYNENSERPNIAEILIEKHRNGPTGKVELYFDEKHTSFMEIEKTQSGDAFEQI